MRRPGNRATGWRALAALSIAAALLLLGSGCREDIQTGYGLRKSYASESVNGTGVLGEMFEQAGHRVLSWSTLTPKLRERADVIVWFPNDFEVPPVAVRQWLEEWLDGAGARWSPDGSSRPRTLIYVGRDFDAAPLYWSKIRRLAPADQRAEIDQRKAKALNDYLNARPAQPGLQDARWFTLDPNAKTRQVRRIQGDSQWTEGIDPAKLEIELRSRFKPSEYAEVLLESDGDMLVSEESWDNGRLIVVTNGSFLLNLPLVNHEHRKLAGQLVTEVGPAPQTVVFLESYAGGPPIRDTDPSLSPPTGLEIFNLWPTSWILLHLAAAGIIFCFARWPIFGIPLEPEPAGLSDFGKHVDALGELYGRTGDESFARARIAQYQQVLGSRQ